MRAKEPVHGRPSEISNDGKTIFSGLPKRFQAGRYHSLVIERDSLPPSLEISAETDDGTIMAVRHNEMRVEGVQFHPESILSHHGLQLLQNFLDLRNDQ